MNRRYAHTKTRRGQFFVVAAVYDEAFVGRPDEVRQGIPPRSREGAMSRSKPASLCLCVRFLFLRAFASLGEIFQTRGRWLAWQIATASASAASAPAIFAPGSRTRSIACTCSLAAPPVPTIEIGRAHV